MKSPWTAPARRRRGVTLVESAIAVPILLMVLFAIFDVSRLLYSHFAIQHAVREGARFAVTGRRLSDPDTGGFFSRRDSIVRRVVEQAEPFVTLQTAAVTLTSATGGPDSGGGPGDLVTVRVIHPVDLITPFSVFFPNGEVVFNVASVFKNEPFPSSFTD
ncbi:MAG: TadE/TadG family type IV pilus assembly protein [Planctomycetota bacterium]